MKSAYVFKLFFVLAIGVLSGEGITRDYEKWHGLGRAAFLAYQGNRFDRYMAHPAPGAIHAVTLPLLLLFLAALYEVVAFLGAKCVALIVDSVRHP